MAAGEDEFREVGGVSYEPFDFDLSRPSEPDDDGIVIKHIFWEDPDGNVLGLIASPAGLSVAIHEAGEAVGKAVSIRGETVPDFTKFLLECAAQFGKVWRAKSERNTEAAGFPGSPPSPMEDDAAQDQA